MYNFSYNVLLVKHLFACSVGGVYINTCLHYCQSCVFFWFILQVFWFFWKIPTVQMVKSRLWGGGGVLILELFCFYRSIMCHLTKACLKKVWTFFTQFTQVYYWNTINVSKYQLLDFACFYGQFELLFNTLDSSFRAESWTLKSTVEIKMHVFLHQVINFLNSWFAFNTWIFLFALK